MKKFQVIVTIIGLLPIISCEDFLKIDPPKTDLTTATVFENDKTATATLLDIYYQMSFTGFASGDQSSITVLTSLSADELATYNAAFNQEFEQFNHNSLIPSNTRIQNLWSESYKSIYKTNSILEGLKKSLSLTTSLKTQLEGEAKFIRAFCHFYLTNLFGDIPLVLTTDYGTNSVIGRVNQNEVYQQIIDDLVDSQSLLRDDYSFSNGERIRPNKWASIALLARAYLYTKDWINAESLSTEIIDNTQNYSLVSDLNGVFLANSSEAIWQLMSASPSLRNTWEAGSFIFTGNPAFVALTQQLINSFEPGDYRQQSWLGSTTNGSASYYYSFKYKIPGPTDPLREYSTVLRLAEQYLIRAEARVNQGNLQGAVYDINVIRSRAGLPSLSSSLTKEQVTIAIMQERKVELFTEWGHRWLDLKRSNLADSELGPLKIDWQATDKLYPIPQIQIQNDPAMVNSQNPGY